MNKKFLLIIMFIFSLSLVSGLGENYNIEGNKVFINDSKIYMSAEPHTIKGSGEITFNIISKIYNGDVNLILGFNDSNTKPISLTYKGLSLTPDKTINQEFNNKNIWYAFTNLNIEKNKNYELKLLLKVINSGKYDIAIYPSSYGYNIGQAINDNNLYVLDPWYDEENNLLAYYNFNEGTGNTLYDVKNDKDGSINGMTWSGNYPSYNIEGTGADYSGSFDGIDDYVSIPSISGVKSFSGWFNSDIDIVEGVSSNFLIDYNTEDVYDSIGIGYTTSLGTPTADDKMFSIRTSSSSMFYWDSSSIGYNNLSSGVWFNYIVVWDEGNYRLYFNGIDAGLASTVNSPTEINIFTNPRIGTTNLAAFYDGLIDDVMIFNRSLNTSEINYLYDYGMTFDYILSVPFISEWRTNTTNETITLPLVSDGNYDFYVEWGDGTNDTITTYDQAEVTHTYETAGTHEIFINGTIKGWQFTYAEPNNDYNKIYDISQWGSFEFLNDTFVFFGADNLNITANDTPNLENINTLKGMFWQCENFNGNISNWNTSSITDFNEMFGSATSFNQDISTWDVSQGVDFDDMFRNATSFNQDLSNWNIENAKIMNYFLQYVNLSSDYYDNMLNAWAYLSNTPVNITFDGGYSQYSTTGEIGRTILINDYNWTITDGGLLSETNETETNTTTTTGDINISIDEDTKSFFISVLLIICSLLLLFSMFKSFFDDKEKTTQKYYYDSVLLLFALVFYLLSGILPDLKLIFILISAIMIIYNIYNGITTNKV